ncbi:MAG: alkaline phosphatase [Saprospiraceae bacterium]
MELLIAGFKSGMVVTSTIVHATPASFYAHVKHREQYEDIAEELADWWCGLFCWRRIEIFQQKRKR